MRNVINVIEKEIHIANGSNKKIKNINVDYDCLCAIKKLAKNIVVDESKKIDNCWYEFSIFDIDIIFCDNRGSFEIEYYD